MVHLHDDEQSPSEALPTPSETVAAGRSPRRPWRTALSVAGVSLCCAVVFDALLAVSLRTEAQDAVLLGPALLGLGIVWVLVLAVVGLTGSVRVTAVVTLALGAGLAAVNVARMDILLIPLSLRDVVFLSDPAFLVEMVPARDLLAAGIAFVVVVGVLSGVLYRGRRRRRRLRRGDPGWRAWMIFRGTSVAVGVVLVLVASGFNTPGNPLRRAYDASGADWRPWAQAKNYRLNGFVGGVLFNLPVEAMAQPEGYNEATMAEIAERWGEAARVRNRGADPGVMAQTNVVVVLSESMGDPAALEHATFAEDPLPVIHSLMESGGAQMLSNYYGTGTSSMEFSVLTGQNTSLFRPQISSPYQQFVTDHPDYPNAVGWLRSLGHRAVAIHPYTPHMYQRPDVYKNFGFEKFIDRDQMTERQRLGNNGGFISDRSAYREVLRELRDNDDPMVVQLISMQNHLPYRGRYEDPIAVTGKNLRGQAVGQWARGVKGTDEAVEEFLGELGRTGERTLVIQYGDHFPGIFSDAHARAEGLNLYRTPFFIWDSAHPKGAGLKGNPAGGPVAASAALELAWQQIGAPLPPYFALLAEVQEKVGVVRGRRVVTPEGEEIGVKDLTPEQRSLLDDLRLVQYDFSIGERYALASMWYSPGR